LQRPEIQYPCRWTYAVIGLDEEDLRMAIAAVVRRREHRLSFSRHSAHKKYCSLHLELTVENEADRNRLFVSLKNQPSVKMVL